MDSLKGKVIIITGSSSGIGRATAVAFAKYDTCIVLCGQNEDNLKITQQECIKNGSKSENIVYVKADLCKEDGILSTINKAIDKFGGIDVLVNNAGIGLMANTEQTKMEDYDNVFNINVKACFRITQLAIPYLKKSKGAVINVSSICGSKGHPETPVYNMSKAALNMFTETLALELAPHKVRVNAVCPGIIRTNMHQRLGINSQQLDQVYKAIHKIHPISRVGEPEDVANFITFLASDGAGFITGAKMPIDGGMCATSSWLNKD